MKVIAVIVTRNRLRLMQRCLERVRENLRLGDEIIVVDNGSSDGSREFLAAQPDTYSVFQDNLGGAGGFFTGIREALRIGADLVWCMDDDGYPDRNCLQNLIDAFLQVRDQNSIINAIVVNESQHDALAFGVLGTSTLKDASQRAVNGLLLGAINNFNGTLIPAHVLNKLGNIKKEMFIWGDETEFALRAARSGVSLVTVVNAKFFHPPSKTQIEKIPGNIFGSIAIKPLPLGFYAWRNLGYLSRSYPERFPATKIFGKMILFYTLNLKPLTAIRLSLYFLDGYFNFYLLKVNGIKVRK